MGVTWPAGWQDEAIDAVVPFLGVDERLEIVVDPPTAIHGTWIGGFVYLDGDTPMIIHDHSGRRDVYPGPLLRGPVLRIYHLRPRRRKLILFADPRWTPRGGEKGTHPRR